MTNRQDSHEDGNLLYEMRVLKPRVERLLQTLEERAKHDGAFEAKVDQLASDVKWLLTELRDSKPSLVAVVGECSKRIEGLEAYRKEQVETEKEHRRERARNILTLLLAIGGWLIALAALFKR